MSDDTKGCLVASLIFLAIGVIFIWVLVGPINDKYVAQTQKYRERCEQIGGQYVDYRHCINKDHVELFIPWSEYN